MTPYKKHKIRIESPHGKAMLSKIFIDDLEMRGVYAVHIEIDPASNRRDVLVTLTLGPSELHFEGEGIVKVIAPPRLRPEDPPPQLVDEEQEGE